MRGALSANHCYIPFHTTKQMSSTATQPNSPPAYIPPGENEEPETEGEVPDDFKFSDIVAECDVGIRHRFIQRVYLLLAVQLAITASISAALIMHPAWQAWTLSRTWPMIVSAIGSIGCMIGTMVMRRKYPWNLLFLSLFTLAESWLVGIISSITDTNTVIHSFAITTVVFVGLSILAWRAKYDFASWAPYLGMILFGLVGLGFVMVFTSATAVELMYSYIAVVLFSVFIIVDTQMIIRKFHPEDEIPAAIQLYLDIINLFVNLLRILNSSSS